MVYSCGKHLTLTECLNTIETTVEPSTVPAGNLALEFCCLLERYKHRIINLRRGEAAHWQFFKQEVQENVAWLVNVLSSRWLVSALDTYVDYGDPIESRNALMIVVMLNWEKLAFTQRLSCGVRSDSIEYDPSDIELLKSPTPAWDGMHTLLLTVGANMILNMFKRLNRKLAETPTLMLIGDALIQRMLASHETTIGLLQKVHERNLGEDMKIGLLGPDTDAIFNSYEYNNIFIEKLHKKVDALSDDLKRLSLFTEQRFQDVLSTTITEPLAISLKAERAIAYDSVDHIYPHGTAVDNTRWTRFVSRCESVLPNRPLTYLDLGCSGGGMVLDFVLRGHQAFGLEGSDFSYICQRAEWAILRNRLFVCDIGHPFQIYYQDELLAFDVITAWDVLEHIPQERLPTLLNNVKNHLSKTGLFIASVSTRQSRLAPDGSAYHATVKPRDWWLALFHESGFAPVDDTTFLFEDFPRGNGINFPANFRANPETGFHIILRVAPDDVKSTPTF